MTQFDEREQAFENKFGHDEELEFKISSRMARLFGLWAAERLGLTGADAEKYADRAVDLEITRSGRVHLIDQTEKDCKAKGLSQPASDREGDGGMLQEGAGRKCQQVTKIHRIHLFIWKIKMPEPNWPKEYDELAIGRICERLHYPLNDAAFAAAMKQILVRFPDLLHSEFNPYWPFVLRYTLTKLDKNYHSVMKELINNPPTLGRFANAGVLPLPAQNVLKDGDDRRHDASAANTLITNLSHYTLSRIFPRREDPYGFDGAMKLQILSLGEVYVASNGFGGMPVEAQSPFPESSIPQETLRRGRRAVKVALEN